ncbi:hypothetical protein NIES2111_29870 [Nostoc sp. NIES-2111]|nr:hypothetical protein NIES2111_29870 [Nostoc sp. NIES-2111]
MLSIRLSGDEGDERDGGDIVTHYFLLSTLITPFFNSAKLNEEVKSDRLLQ